MCRVLCDAYRLGDFVSGYWSKHDGVQRNQTLLNHACGRWPRSVACCYAQGHDLCSCIQEKSWLQKKTSPYLAVHLRLGDVLDWPHYRNARGCGRYEVGCHYVHPLSFYRTVHLPPETKESITLVVGNPHYRQLSSNASQESFAYRYQVAQILKNRGLRLRIVPSSWQWDGNEDAEADRDLAIMTQAKWLIPARGGFGQLARRCSRGSIL